MAFFDGLFIDTVVHRQFGKYEFQANDAESHNDQQHSAVKWPGEIFFFQKGENKR